MINKKETVYTQIHLDYCYENFSDFVVDSVNYAHWTFYKDYSE